jgi:glucokinase
MAYYLGIEIGGTKLQLLLADEHFNQLRTFRFEIDKAQGAKAIRSAIENAFTELKPFNLNGVGVGFGGPINKHSGKIFRSYHIEGWSDFSITEWLQNLCGCPVTVDNDANAAALAEAKFGAGKTFNSVFYVTLGSGVGSGLVVNHQIFHGAEPGETEFGHIRLSKTGPSVQDSCSGWAVNEKIIRAAHDNRDSILSRLAGTQKKDESKILMEAIQQGDKIARQIFDETIDDLSFALSHPIHLFHPDTIILGGGLSLIGEPLRVGVEKNVKKYIMDAFQPGPSIQLSQLKENAVPLGALAFVINK